jgi:hypothetical protein
MLIAGFAVAGALATASAEFDTLVVVAAFWTEEAPGAALVVVAFAPAVGTLGFRPGSVPSFVGVG